jgi:hypothetical protein
MRCSRWPLVVVAAMGLHTHAQAGGGLGIFSRKPKQNPAEQVPALIMQVKTDKDEGKRATAAEELRNYDPKAFPEVLTVLTDALLKDVSPSVRAESASTIAKLRPINQQAGFALEQASANDPSLRVRVAAKQALWQYHLVGYRSGRPAETADAKRGPQLPPVTAARPGQPHVSAKNPRTGGVETAEPPLADSPADKTESLPSHAPPKLIPPSASNVGPKLPPPAGS